MCIGIYIFCFNQKKHAQKKKQQKTKENRKTKQKKPEEEKEKENVVIVNNICGKSNGIQWYRLTICCVLLTYLISLQKESAC